jgi:hypothetical protein
VILGRRSAQRRRRLGGVLLVIAAGVAFVPQPARADPTDDLSSSTVHQVTVTIDRLDPQILKANSTVTVSGTLTNTTKHAMTSPWVRLQSGPALTSRSQLSTNPPTPSTACQIVYLSQSLQPGKPVPYTAKCSVSQLDIGQAGVYPLLVNLNATQFDTSIARVGEAQTTLPYFPTKPKSPTKVSWLWPIVDRPHQYTPGLQYGPEHKLPPGVFRDDALAGALAPTGRLGRLVSAPLNLPGKVSLTVVIDPELVSEVAEMTKGYRVAQGSKTVPGTGKDVARQWLNRLQQLVQRPGISVVALPYADPDLVALADNGLGGQIGSAYQQGVSVLQAHLKVPQLTSLAWPADGELDNTTLYALAGQSLSGVVVSPDALPLQSSRTPTPDAAAQIQALGSTVHGVVTDRRLDDLAAVNRFPSGLRLVEQRFDSELAMITAEAPGNARNVVIAPPRRWATSPTYLKMLLSDTASLPWATGGTVSAALAATPTARRGSLTFNAAARKAVLPASQTKQLNTIDTELDSFGKALSNSDADRLLTPYYRAMLTASSSAWRTDLPLGESFVRDLGRAYTGLAQKVYIVPPSKTYTLASSSSPLVLTVANTLGVAVKVRVALHARGSAGFRAQSVELTVQPGDRPTIKVPTHVERSGVFSADATLTTAGGQPLGSSVQLRVRSTAYGVVTLAITGGAFGLLLLLVGRRLYRRFRTSRRPPPPPDPSLEYPTGEFPTQPLATRESGR